MQKQEIIDLILSSGSKPESSKDSFDQEYCVDRLLKKGYRHGNLHLEKQMTTWPVSREA